MPQLFDLDRFVQAARSRGNTWLIVGLSLPSSAQRPRSSRSSPRRLTRMNLALRVGIKLERNLTRNLAEIALMSQERTCEQALKLALARP